MANSTSELKFTKSHEWLAANNNTVTVGISQHAQGLLGDIVFVDLPSINDTIAKGDEIAVLESVKTAADVYAPVSGTIVEVNTNLESQPELINQAPEDGGWIFRIEISDTAELTTLMSFDQYQQTISEE